jgi:hypothetical protein
MQVTRTVELGTGIDDVRRFLDDPERLADWLGDDLRGVDVTSDGGVLRWTWTSGGVESTVELTATGDGESSTVTVVERAAGGAPAASCSVARWEGALLDLELRALSWQHRLARTPR